MRRESEICNASAILEVSGKPNLLMNLNRVPLIVLGFFNFHFRGSVWGSVGGQLTRGQCFVETRTRVELIRIYTDFKAILRYKVRTPFY